ncbi:type II toxin-antitoxin system RnlA family toxin [Photobacterium profundum]|nr:type II toxin-antitoxin system RnlA family toxin [Photobacterium profundum]
MQTEKLSTYVDEFLTVHNAISMEARDITQSKQTFKFIKTGQDVATVIVYIKQGGLVTITYKTGKNHALGKVFHDFLEQKCESADANKANLVLKGMSSDEIEFVLALMGDELVEGEKAFSITTANPTPICQKYTITCDKFKDNIVLLYHTTTYKLQIQGRALFCYRTLCYHLSALLDQQSLLAVVEKKSAEDKVVLHEEVASIYIKKALPNAFERLDDTYRSLLSSSYCVKLASPSLSEYSMLIYPDLRVLEGVIKEAMAKNDLYTSSEGIDIGEYFTHGRQTELKTEYNSNFQSESEIRCLEQCYAYFKAHRHSLFHMDESGYESRTTDTIGEVMQMSEKIAELIDAMYSSCKKL